MKDPIEKEDKKIKFPPFFFEDEVRDGFYVPTMTKRYWAGNLKVLSEIKRICEKYKIRWFAMLGTLLGAVRHKGNIPWDDDLDICMLRSDYERFFDVAVNELPEGYMLLDLRTTPGFDKHVRRVVSQSSIDYSNEHMKDFMGCPYIVGVDIFVLDDVYDNSDTEGERISRLNEINKAIILLNNGQIKEHSLKEQIMTVEKINGINLEKCDDLKHELYVLSDRIHSEYRSDKAEYVAVMAAFSSYGIGMYPKDIFSKTIELPYENICVSVPEKYDVLLKIMYGDYMIPVREASSHDYPLYEKEEKMLIERLGFNPSRYTVSEEELTKVARLCNGRKTTEEICFEILNTINSAALLIKKTYNSNDAERAVEMMEAFQKLVIVMGTTIEKHISNSKDVVSGLEDLCEYLYEVHEMPNAENVEILCSAIDNICCEVKDFLISRKKLVLFVPCTARWWDAMLPYYEDCINDVNLEVKVLPIPYYEMYYDGSVELINEVGSFPESIKTIPVTEYDFEHGYSDEIVIQIPYDESSTVIRVPKFFYSDNLINYTDRLTYIPYLEPDNPEEGDERSVKTLNVLIEQPAVLYSDKIILGSKEMKNLYVNRMVELAGKESKEYWENKIVIR